jgi:membrane fusion protein, multidrug efflux system
MDADRSGDGKKMRFQNQYSAPANHRALAASLLWIPICLIALESVGCTEKVTARLTEVEVAKPVRADVPLYSEWIGTTVGYIDAQIHSKVTGYLLNQDYKDGSLVRAGDLLFEVDPRPFQAVVDQAKAQLHVASAELIQARADEDAAQAEIDRAVAAQVRTELDVKRYTPLVRDCTVSQQEFDDADQSNLANQASVVAAKAKYNHALAAVKGAEAQIEVARSSLQGAQLNLGFTKVKSPINGMAGIRVANIGDLVGTDQRALLTTVSQIDPIYVQFPISEKEYLGLHRFFVDQAARQEDALQLILPDGTVYDHKGKIEIIGREVDTSTGTLRIRGIFPNPGNVLRPGQYSRIRTATNIAQGALLVPQRAVEELQGEYDLAVLDQDNRVTFRKVHATNRVGSYWVIEQGLSANDRVVIEGLQKIKTGGRVEPKDANLPPRPSDLDDVHGSTR